MNKYSTLYFSELEKLAMIAMPREVSHQPDLGDPDPEPGIKPFIGTEPRPGFGDPSIERNKKMQITGIKSPFVGGGQNPFGTGPFNVPKMPTWQAPHQNYRGIKSPSVGGGKKPLGSGLGGGLGENPFGTGPFNVPKMPTWQAPHQNYRKL
jgi:hypothetical protein